MDTILAAILNITLIIFMIGSLLEMGLKLKVGDAVKALRNVRFLLLTLLWGYILCPALALVLTKIIPLTDAYATGMMFLSMAPCAPFFPMAAHKARGDLAFAAALMLLTAVCTVIYLPCMTPLLVPGLTADTWSIAKPLLFFILMPMVMGMAIRHFWPVQAETAHPVCKKITVLDMAIMCGLVLWVYRADLVDMVGTYAIGTQFLFYALVTAGAYWLGVGLTHPQKSVLALGISTRNIGAAIAPLLAIPGTDQRTIAMAVMAVPITAICAFGAAPLLAHFERTSDPAYAKPQRYT